MKSSNLIGIGLVGVGGYFLLKYMGVDLFGSTPAPTTTTTTSTTNGTSSVAQTTKQLIANALVADNQNPNAYHSVDYWNFYYNRVRGVNGPAPEDLFPGADRNKNYSLDEWWAAMAGDGFSGLGVIVPRVNPYLNRGESGLVSVPVRTFSERRKVVF